MEPSRPPLDVGEKAKKREDGHVTRAVGDILPALGLGKKPKSSLRSGSPSPPLPKRDECVQRTRLFDFNEAADPPATPLSLYCVIS